MQTLTFQNTYFDIVDRNGQPWLRYLQIGDALGYSSPHLLNNVYQKNADEFTDSMTDVVELDTAGGKQQVRIFSLRGAHLLGMLSRTKKAKEFRAWVLDVLDNQNQHQNLNINFTVRRWITENHRVFKDADFLEPSNRLKVPVGALYGMDSKSPTLALLSLLEKAGYEVEASKLEVMALKDHLEILAESLKNGVQNPRSLTKRAPFFTCRTKEDI